MENLYSTLLMFFSENPNLSPLVVINNPNYPPGILAGALVILREEGKLIVTGEDENGVLLSVAPELTQTAPTSAEATT